MKRLLFFALILITAHSSVFANLNQGNWRWRNNDGTEKTATWKAGKDTAVVINDYKAFRLRAEVYNNTGADQKTISHGLQYATSPSGPWYALSSVSAINAFVFAGDNIFITDGDSTTLQIPNSGYTFLPGVMVTTAGSTSDSFNNKYRREYEWCIKPTTNILANTTYYFKSDAVNVDNPLPSLTTGGAFTPAPTPLLVNGSFENDLNNWTTATANGSSASFNITAAALKVHTGAKGLAVTVSNKGTSNSVTLTSGQINLSDTGTYLLRFWAIAKQRNALLDINIEGATTNNTCHYQIYNRFDTTSNGWQMYQYAFRVTEKPVALQMSFNTNTTYNLDDIEIIDDTTNPNVDVKNQYYWQNNFAESYGWMSGDNNNPVLLPDKRIAWVYNDSYMGNNNPHSNVLTQNRIANNLVVVQDSDQLHSIYGGTTGNAQALFNPGNGHIFWQSGGIVENGQLKTLMIEIDGGNYNGHSWIGSLSLPELKPVSLNRLPLAVSSAPNCVFSDGAYDYIYFGASSAQNEVHTVVGRVPAGQFDSQTPYEYYMGDTTWGADFTQAKNILENVPAGNVLKIGPGNYAMSAVPNLAPEISVWFAPTPWGPWGNKVVVYNTPLQEGILAYQGHMVANGDKGVYTFTCSVYPFVNEPNGSSGSVAMQLAVKTTYVPPYAKANLLALSPYTPRLAADTLVSLTAQDSSQKVVLNWISAKTDDDHYDVQHSIDSTTWTTISTVAGSDSTTLANYKLVDENAITGLNYYRIALYDIDSKLSYSQIVSVNTLQSAVLTGFTANPKDAKVELDWATSSELNNPGFVVQRSTDGTTFATIASVAGKGTSSVTNTYQSFDNSPIDGINYYRLQYLFNSEDTTSVVRMVDMTQALAVNVYPNPTNSNIQFGLKGYKGTSINTWLYNLAGKKVDTEVFTKNSSGLYVLQLKPQPGVYLLKITGDGLNKKVKVIVE